MPGISEHLHSWLRAAKAMASLSSIESHLKCARDHANREEYTAALVYFDGVLGAINRCVHG